MAELTDDQRVAGEIGTYLRGRRAAYNSTQPLEPPTAPAILSDVKADPVRRAEAARQFAEVESLYAKALLSRKSLTDAEQRWLTSQISRCLKGE
jgi:hypothetical protein